MASSSGPVSPETYWKRRVFVLAGLLLVVALIAHACNHFSAGDGEQAADKEAEPSPETSSSSGPPSSPTPTAESSPDGAGEEGEDEGEGANEGAGNPGGQGGGADAAEGGGAAAASDEAADPCRPRDIVVTMATDKEDYAWDEEPEIELTIVNTADRPCTLDVGPKSMEVRVTSGDDRVFSTADCVKGQGTDNERLARGVPRTTVVTWDRTRSWQDCRDHDVNAPSGTYVASLHGDYSEGAEKRVFRLN